MSRRKRSSPGLKLRPSYTTRVHLKRRLLSTDWRFIVAMIGLGGMTAAAATLLR